MSLEFDFNLAPPYAGLDQTECDLVLPTLVKVYLARLRVECSMSPDVEPDDLLKLATEEQHERCLRQVVSEVREEDDLKELVDTAPGGMRGFLRCLIERQLLVEQEERNPLFALFGSNVSQWSSEQIGFYLLAEAAEVCRFTGSEVVARTIWANSDTLSH